MSRNTAVENYFKAEVLQVWEYERYLLFSGKWQAPFLPTDPWQFCDAHGGRLKDFDGSSGGTSDPVAPSTGVLLVWDSNWKPLHWEYALDFVWGFHTDMGVTDHVRRRKWERRYRWVPKPGDPRPLREWLASIGCEGITEVMYAHGFRDARDVACAHPDDWGKLGINLASWKIVQAALHDMDSKATDTARVTSSATTTSPAKTSDPVSDAKSALTASASTPPSLTSSREGEVGQAVASRLEEGFRLVREAKQFEKEGDLLKSSLLYREAIQSFSVVVPFLPDEKSRFLVQKQCQEYETAANRVLWARSTASSTSASVNSAVSASAGSSGSGGVSDRSSNTNDAAAATVTSTVSSITLLNSSTAPSDITSTAISTVPSDITSTSISTAPSDITSTVISTVPSDITSTAILTITRDSTSTSVSTVDVIPPDSVVDAVVIHTPSSFESEDHTLATDPERSLTAFPPSVNLSPISRSFVAVSSPSQSVPAASDLLMMAVLEGLEEDLSSPPSPISPSSFASTSGRSVSVPTRPVSESVTPRLAWLDGDPDIDLSTPPQTYDSDEDDLPSRSKAVRATRPQAGQGGQVAKQAGSVAGAVVRGVGSCGVVAASMAGAAVGLAAGPLGAVLGSTVASTAASGVVAVTASLVAAGVTGTGNLLGSVAVPSNTKCDDDTDEGDSTD